MKTKLALIDVDGVIADERHRVQFALDKKWAEYFHEDRMSKDAVWREGFHLIKGLERDGWTIAYLTGRRDDRREVTEEWMDRHGFPAGRLIMRPKVLPYGQPKLRLAEFKEKTIQALGGREAFEKIVLFDDDPEVIRHIKKTIGEGFATYVGWNVKPKALIKTALA
jgi:uncharacterized HAD superfamily protein